MVRINLIEPRALADQHLVAEYHEILMLLGALRKYPDMDSEGAHFMKNPVRYFCDKLGYIERRHRKLRAEMKRRGFKARLVPKFGIYPKRRMKNFAPNAKQIREIKQRLVLRIRNPPRKGFYRYGGKKETKKFLVSLIRKAGV